MFNLRKALLPTTLLARFFLIIIVPVLICQLLAVYLFYQRHWYNVSNNTSHFLAVEVAALVGVMQRHILSQEQGTYLNLEYKVYPNKQLPTINQSYPAEIAIFASSIQSAIDRQTVIAIEDSKAIILYLRLGNDLLEIKLPYKALLNPTTGIFVLWIIALTVLLLSVSLIFSKNQIRSIIALSEVAEKYGQGAKIQYYKPSGAKEIRQAGIAFLKMKDRIEKQAAQRTKMLAMISHDLRTPLTRMKLQTELMDASEEKEELQYDINSMQHMIDSYLDFVRGENGEQVVSTEMNQWISHYINSKWGDQDITFIPSAIAITLAIKPLSFERAIANVISNALKYATKVLITISLQHEGVIIKIDDNGSGIKNEERNLVFKPFYRGDKSRSLDTSSGVGLGLAITREIIRSHYGAIRLDDSNVLGGLSVIMTLPHNHIPANVPANANKL